jgi:hypothetical protein
MKAASLEPYTAVGDDVIVLLPELFLRSSKSPDKGGFDSRSHLSYEEKIKKQMSTLDVHLKFVVHAKSCGG